MLSEQFRNAKKVCAEKMMPVTQMLFIHLLLQNTDYTLKSVAADELGLTRTSMTRASEQVLAMGLIDQEKVWKEREVKENYLESGESALSQYSMLNAPKVKTVALYKGAIEAAELEEIDARWKEAEKLLQLELWKYDQFVFADGDKVDRISLACTLTDCEDEGEEIFKDYPDCYTVIGGTACDILMSEADLDFRATKDIDMILILEDRHREFATVFREYIREGTYR